MTVTGAHVILYSPEADALRATLGDTFGWRNVDAGGGWLIFALPPAEVAVHPSDKPAHELTLMCDDLEATMTELREKGVEFKGEPHEERWGLVATMVLPGGVEMLLYEPRHPTAI
ncbi:MAG: extradiol dioxygenase [Acidimicrobiia bacterium]|nr:extradiol dioxygenase [Acidimicrobiia bacterium]